MKVTLVNTDPGDSLQSLLHIIILIEAVIVVQTELVKPRSAEIATMQILSSLSLFLLKGPSLESDVISEVPPDGG